MRIDLDRSELLPGEELVATLHIDKGLDRVTAAQVELGFDNAFLYRWAGHRDAAMTNATDVATLLTDTPGTTYGGEKEGTAWVPVYSEQLRNGGELPAGTHHFRWTIPSWAPPSSKALARWEVRAAVERRRGRDATAAAQLAVLGPRPTLAPEELEQRVPDNPATAIDITLEEAGARPGGVIRGSAALTPQQPGRIEAITAFLYRDRLSHPVEHNAAGGESGWKSRDKIVTKPELPAGVTHLPFKLEVPADAAPTGEAPNSTVRWWVEISVRYQGLVPDHPADKARREVIVFNSR